MADEQNEEKFLQLKPPSCGIKRSVSRTVPAIRKPKRNIQVAANVPMPTAQTSTAAKSETANMDTPENVTLVNEIPGNVTAGKETLDKPTPNKELPVKVSPNKEFPDPLVPKKEIPVKVTPKKATPAKKTPAKAPANKGKKTKMPPPKKPAPKRARKNSAARTRADFAAQAKEAADKDAAELEQDAGVSFPTSLRFVEQPSFSGSLDEAAIAESIYACNIIKITSWNVAGINALARKKGTYYLLNSNADFVCLQEIRCTKKNLPPEIQQLDGYPYNYWCESNRPGYAGCATWSKKKPMSSRFGIGHKDFDTEGRLITLEFEKFYLVNVYAPTAGRKLVNYEKRLQWDGLFKTFLESLEKVKPIIVMGDFNVAHQEIDLAKPATNTKTAGFTEEERKGMTNILELGLIDTYRLIFGPTKSVYTFWPNVADCRAKNIGWRFDYALISKKLENDLVHSDMFPIVEGSDHCPIGLVMRIGL